MRLLAACNLAILSIAAEMPPPTAAPRCLPRMSVQGPLALGDGRIVLLGQPDRRVSYEAHFQPDCVHADRFSTVAIASTAIGYCTGDRVRIVRSPSGPTGPACAITHFTPIDGRDLP